MNRVLMLVTISSRKKISEFVKFYKTHQVETGTISLGRGTASSEVLDCLGMEDEEKGIFFSVITEPTCQKLQKGLQKEMKIDIPGTGIAFTVPLSSIGGKRTLAFFLDGQEFEKEEETELKDAKHELIIAIANYGYTTKVMEAARTGGATGGTVLHGKGVGMKRAEQFLGVSLVSEKEVIFIVSKKEEKNAIMNAIMEKTGIGTKAGAIVFSLPVTETAGLRLLEEL